MKFVALSSGGLDSTLMILLAKQQGFDVAPLFVDYGQRARDQEFKALEKFLLSSDLPMPKIVNVSEFGSLASSGLTSEKKDVFLDAFLPGRNLMFLLLASTYAYEIGASTIGIGLLREDTTLFPDQKMDFINKAKKTLSQAIGRELEIILPLSHMTKADVLEVSKQYGIMGTYSCHSGGVSPCGVCVACREYDGLEI